MTTHLHIGDNTTVLPALAAAGARVHSCITSPPYFGLRDYHVPPTDWPAVTYTPAPGLAPVTVAAERSEVGLETDPGAYVAHLVHVMRLVRDVLRDDGSLWLNLGDTYVDGGRGTDDGSTLEGSRHNQRESRAARPRMRRRPFGLGAKQLLGLPWRVALALQADGWYLRCDVIWHKPNPMPENVNDRPTRAHEYLFLFTKRARYYYDRAAIDEPVTAVTLKDNPDDARRRPRGLPGTKQPSRSGGRLGTSAMRNRRSVWTVASQPYSGAHFATFPPKLVEPCVLACVPLGGVVLDPYAGAGTVGLVADRVGRDAHLIELNPAYSADSGVRIANDAPLLADVRPAVGA